MHDIAQTTEILSRLRLKGIDLAIDDLGTGYSSLGALRQMPFSEMKIDGSFIRDMATSPDTVAVVKSLIDLAHKLGITSVAEGVEDQPTTQRLIDLGIDYLQGYHFSRPLAMERLLPWLRTQPIAPSA
jgi:EAL domain-containing protein (putative c-di-GMP-specific phosphodiesterase class I)